MPPAKDSDSGIENLMGGDLCRRRISDQKYEICWANLQQLELGNNTYMEITSVMSPLR